MKFRIEIEDKRICSLVEDYVNHYIEEGLIDRDLEKELKEKLFLYVLDILKETTKGKEEFINFYTNVIIGNSLSLIQEISQKITNEKQYIKENDIYLN